MDIHGTVIAVKDLDLISAAKIDPTIARGIDIEFHVEFKVVELLASVNIAGVTLSKCHL